MVLAVSLTNGALRLDERDDFAALAVVVTGSGRARLSGLLGDEGRMEGDHVWLRAGWLETLGADSVEWRMSFRAMLDQVEPLGWYARDRDEVRAHLEWRG